jgi:hypothetical protein
LLGLVALLLLQKLQSAHTPMPCRPGITPLLLLLLKAAAATAVAAAMSVQWHSSLAWLAALPEVANSTQPRLVTLDAAAAAAAAAVPAVSQQHQPAVQSQCPDGEDVPAGSTQAMIQLQYTAYQQ